MSTIGWYGSNSNGVAYNPRRTDVISIVSNVAHYAVRIKFGIYLYYYDYVSYYYPLNYSIDGTTYRYDQSKENYWSCYDIVTSPQQAHYDASLTVGWAITDNSLPYNTYNTNGCGSCTCYGSTFGCSSFYGSNCCADKYIQILDLLVMVSRCP